MTSVQCELLGGRSREQVLNLNSITEPFSIDIDKGPISVCIFSILSSVNFFKVLTTRICLTFLTPNILLFLLRGALGFTVLRFWLFFRSVFVPKNLGFSVLVFISVCGFFRLLASGFRFSRKYERVFGFDIRCGFRFFLFDLSEFRFLFDLSGNYAPSLISNSS